MYLFFFVMVIIFVSALITLPVIASHYVPWWGTVAIIVAELIFLRYALFKILGLMFGIFVSVGLRIGTQGMRGATVNIHSINVVPPPDPLPPELAESQSGSIDDDPDEAPEPDAPGTRYIVVDCTVTPSRKSETSDWPVKHYDAGSFALSAQTFIWPSFPPKEDDSRTGRIVAANRIENGASSRITLDTRLLGSQRLQLTFKCPPTLQGRARLKFIVLKLADVELPAPAGNKG